MKTMSLLCCLGLLSCAGVDSQTQIRNDPEMVKAPIRNVGPRMEDWLKVFGADYKISTIRGMKNLHTQEPNAILGLTNGSTSVLFQVDFITNRHYLLEVETSSLELIDRLAGVTDQLPPGRLLTYEDCFDAGCSRLVLKRGKKSASALWTYYWD